MPSPSPSPTKFSPASHPLTQATNRAVLAIAERHGFQVALVGGYVRDALLGRYDSGQCAHDFDYAVLSGRAIELGGLLSQELGGNFVLLDEAEDTCRVVLSNSLQVDLAGCLGGSLEADLRRRNLTINALAWQACEPDAIIDVVGGLSDLYERRIRLISEQALIADPLRLLRVFRFAATTGFAIDPDSLALVERHAGRLDSMPAERISYELFAMLGTDRAAQAIAAMAKTPLLEIIFPELTATHHVPPNAFHHLGLFDHSLETLRQCELAYPELPDWAKEAMQKTIGHQASRLTATKLAALLHDIGKPQTWVVRPDGKHTFIAHDTAGETMIVRTAGRLRWSRPMERVVGTLIRLHLRPGALFHQGRPTDRALYRFYRDVGPDVPELILLAQADFRATCGIGLQEQDKRGLLENQLAELLQRYGVFIESQKRAPRLLNGLDVMKLLGIDSSPAVGALLDDLEEARSLGEVVNKQQAETFIVDRYKQKYSS